jgi:hypothetical protein
MAIQFKFDTGFAIKREILYNIWNIHLYPSLYSY